MTAILLIFAVIAYFYFYVGAYLYEKLTGTVTLRRKKPVEDEPDEDGVVPAEKPNQSAFSIIASKVKKWREDREKEKLQKESAERKIEIQNLQREGVIQLEAARRQKEIERQKIIENRKNAAKDFFHKIGIYKTPEEKKQIALQKEKENQERMKQEEEARKQRELEKKGIGQDRLRKEEESKRLKEAEARRKTEEERKRKLEGERKLQEEIKLKEELKRK